MFLLFQFILLIFISKSSGMKGYNFGDNKMDVRWAPDNGFLKADFSGFVPPALTYCSRFYLSSSRHGDQFAPFEIFTPYDERHPVNRVSCSSWGRCNSGFHGQLFDLRKMLGLENTDRWDSHYPKINLLRKWTSLCVSLDFVNNDVNCFVNGKKFNTSIYEEKRNKITHSMDKRYPEGYFEGRLL